MNGCLVVFEWFVIGLYSGIVCLVADDRFVLEARFDGLVGEGVFGMIAGPRVVVDRFCLLVSRIN